MPPITVELIILLAVVALNAALGGVLASRTILWMRLRALDKKFVLLDDDVGDLLERFERNQKRSGMREAREVKAEQKTLKDEAQAILFDDEETTKPNASKDNLRRQYLRGVRK